MVFAFRLSPAENPKDLSNVKDKLENKLLSTPLLGLDKKHSAREALWAMEGLIPQPCPQKKIQHMDHLTQIPYICAWFVLFLYESQ